ncbi:nicotinate mononucleotide-dependent phosphoribosyltransferase CobT [Pseudanabaena sp. PCC 6802]|uniref:nicotinate mononucleotide-dependent phosphoribosyltransferase CobT n=1 Tax=Pseudanabaena sp. PCC 6802 TaxID=118173 RepID=UPI0005629EF3
MQITTIRAYTQLSEADRWLQTYRGRQPVFACVLGFTATGLIPGISAAGATPESRRYTAIADAEFLATGQNIHFPLPPLVSGASPVLISRAVVAGQNLPLYIFNAGLLAPPTVEHIDLDGKPANCLSTGRALPLATVMHLWQQGLIWGEQLARQGAYVILSECVVGGTTTALAVLTALGINAQDKVNSSHPICNHGQKWELVRQGIQNAKLAKPATAWEIAAAVGDPMQIVAAAIAIAASRHVGVLLAGGTQMLAVYALARATRKIWNPERIVVGTTRWVAEDPTGDTVGLAENIGDVPLLAAQLSFTNSYYPQLRAYEQGFVKEGVGAGGAAIAASLYQGWTQADLLQRIEALMAGQLGMNH